MHAHMCASSGDSEPCGDSEPAAVEQAGGGPVPARDSEPGGVEQADGGSGGAGVCAAAHSADLGVTEELRGVVRHVGVRELHQHLRLCEFQAVRALGVGQRGCGFCMWIPDAAIKEWHEIKLDFPKGIAYSDSYPIGSGYYDSMYACDGGLVCVVPEWDLEYCDCVVVCNPLTDEWRKLPCLWTSYRYRAPVLVQLVTDELFYRVTLVCSEKNLQDVQIYGAFVYHSRTESWSVKNSGLVLGTGSSLWQSKHEPLVFDCAGKVLFELDLNNFAALRDLKRPRCSILNDRMFVLHALINPRRWVISEFMWESSGLDFRKLKEYEVGLEGIEDVRISIATGFILSAWGMETENGSMRELIRMYDVSTGQWHDLPPLIGGPATPIQELFDNFFVCELRWDAEP